MFERRQTREWVHGLTALILGLFLLGGGANLGISKSAVDLLGGMLSIPEYPAVVMRDVLRNWRNWARERSALQNELVRLREENARLRVMGASLSGTGGSGDANAASSSAQAMSMEEARVTLRAPMSWWNEIRIDRGGQDNVTAGLPVFNNGYLVGRITSVSMLSSWAELLTSPSLMIPAVIEETRELGVVVGDGDGSVLLKYIPAGRGPLVGMNVSTALIGEELPPGLPIGKIAEELPSMPDGYAIYRVAPGADFSRFYTVSFLKPPAPGAGPEAAK